MKGPHERLKYELRRLWACRACKRRQRTSGAVTYRHCSCQMKQLDGNPVVMHLVADSIQRLTPPITMHHDPLPPPTSVASDETDKLPRPTAISTDVSEPESQNESQ